MKRFTLLVFSLLMLAVNGLAADISGKWDFVWNVDGGERRSTLNVSVEGTKVSLVFPGTKEPVRGTIEDGKITAEGKVFSGEVGTEGPFRMTGKLTGDTAMEGTAAWGDYAMSFTAKRQSN